MMSRLVRELAAVVARTPVWEPERAPTPSRQPVVPPVVPPVVLPPGVGR